jgi:mannitol-1-phosphate/altronate dehydrogenase
MDEWPVVAEHFGQWIVEDHFVNGQYLQTFKHSNIYTIF